MDHNQEPGGCIHALAEQRLSRKKTQEDVKLLANRIALLKLEEKKVSQSYLLPLILFKLR